VSPAWSSASGVEETTTISLRRPQQNGSDTDTYPGVPFHTYAAATSGGGKHKSFTQLLNDPDQPNLGSVGFNAGDANSQVGPLSPMQTAVYVQENGNGTVSVGENMAVTNGAQNGEAENEIVVVHEALAGIPRLGPHQKLLLINGNFVILNDDTVENENSGEESDTSQTATQEVSSVQNNFNFAVPEKPVSGNLLSANQAGFQREPPPSSFAVNQTLNQQNTANLLSSGLQALMASMTPNPNATLEEQRQQASLGNILQQLIIANQQVLAQNAARSANTQSTSVVVSETQESASTDNLEDDDLETDGQELEIVVSSEDNIDDEREKIGSGKRQKKPTKSTTTAVGSRGKKQKMIDNAGKPGSRAGKRSSLAGDTAPGTSTNR